jgi:endonuclease YncB( thermonuclease family)
MPKLSARYLKKIGVPVVLISGILTAYTLGWDAKALLKASNYYSISRLFPQKAVVSKVEDGDTFLLRRNIPIRLMGINAPDKNEPNYEEAKKYLENLLIENSSPALNTQHEPFTNSNKKANAKYKRVYLEYDRYQDDKFGRLLAWVWVDCETTPKLLPANYMHKSDNESTPGLKENPAGCKKGKLVNEELVTKGLASPVIYAKRGELKYQVRINTLKQNN